MLISNHCIISNAFPPRSTSKWWSRYMSIVPILNMLGSVAAYPMGEWLGRKKVLIWSAMEWSAFSLQQKTYHEWSVGGRYWYRVIGWNTLMPKMPNHWTPIVPHHFCLPSFTILFRSSYSPLFSTSSVLWSSTSGIASNVLLEDYNSVSSQPSVRATCLWKRAQQLWPWPWRHDAIRSHQRDHHHQGSLCHLYSVACWFRAFLFLSHL